MSESGYKGFNYPLKGIVTSKDDPANLNRLQVYIPNYHGERDPSREGPEGSYPWAQVNTLIVPSEQSSNGENSESGGGILGWISGVVQKFKRTFIGNDGRGFESLAPPEVGDVVWLIFEGGDIRCPVYFGTAALPKNAKEKVLTDSGTGAAGSYGDTYQNIDGSSGYTYEFVGGSPVDMIIAIMYNQFGDRQYDKIFPGNGGSISMSLGYIDALAITGDAGRLLQAIYDRDPSSYKNICSNNFGTFIDPSKNWKSQTLPEGNRLTKAIKKILDSPAGHDVQDEMATEEVAKCFASGRSMGITDPPALTFYCDMAHVIGTSGAESVVRNLGSKTLDDIYEASKSVSSYAERGYIVYTGINEMISRGIFVKKTNSTLSGGGDYLDYEGGGGGTTGSSGYYIEWPVPISRNVTKPFSQNHQGIDIQAPANAQVIASHDGHVAIATRHNEYGNYIVLEWSAETKTTYKHLNLMKVHQGDNVQRGSTIGAVGMTGNASGYHLHFEIMINGSNKDPQAFSYGKNSTSSSSSSGGGNILSVGGIWNNLRSHGFSAVAAAAIMGNMEAESALRSNNVQDTSGWDDNEYTNAVDSGTYGNFAYDSIGYGLCQWTISDRKYRLLNYCQECGTSISNGPMQIDYLVLEMENFYPHVYDVLMSTGSIEEASDTFLREFETPEAYWNQYTYRQGLCYKYYNQFA